ACERAGPRMDVAFGRADAIEQAVPFGMIEQALAAIGIAEAVAPATSVIEPSAPFFRVLRALTERVPRPLLIALDDLPFADGDSLRLIAFLARRIARLPVAVIGALRPWPPAAEELCRTLAEDGIAEIGRLSALSRAASDAVLARTVGVEI